MAQDRVLQRILDYSSRNQGSGPSLAEKLERQDIDKFLTGLGDMPTDEGANPALSPAGQRWSHVQKFASGLTPSGAQWMEGQLREQLEADNALRQREWERYTTPPTEYTHRMASWTPFLQTAGDPIGSMTLGHLHSPWASAKSREAMQRGTEDAIVRILVDEERRKGTPEDEWLPRAFERLEKNDLPSGIKWAHRAALLPELAYMMVPFGASGKAASMALGPLGIGKKVAGVAKLGKTAPFMGRTAEHMAHSAATFAGVEAARKPYPDDPNIVMRALHGAKTGLVVGAVAGPVAEGLSRALPAWLQGGERFWEARHLEQAVRKGARELGPVSEQQLAYARRVGRSPFEKVRATGDGNNWVYKDFQGKEWKIDLGKRARSTQEKVGRWLDVPGRAAEAAAFMGMTYTDGVRDADELLFAGMVGTLMPDVIGKPTRFISRYIPGSRAYRDAWARKDALAAAEERTSTQKNVAQNEERAAKRARQKLNIQDPGKTKEEAGFVGEIVPVENTMGIVVKETKDEVSVWDGQNVRQMPREAVSTVPVQEVAGTAHAEELIVKARAARSAMAKMKKGNSNLRERLRKMAEHLERSVEPTEEKGEPTLESALAGEQVPFHDRVRAMRERFTELVTGAVESKEEAALRKKYGLDKKSGRQVYQEGLADDPIDPGAPRNTPRERAEDVAAPDPGVVPASRRVMSVRKISIPFERRTGETEAQFEARKKKEGFLVRRLPRPKSRRQKRLEKERGRPEIDPTPRRWGPTMQMELVYMQPAWEVKVMRGTYIPSATSPDPAGGRHLAPLHVEPRHWEAGEAHVRTYVTTDKGKAERFKAKVKQGTGRPKKPRKPKELKEAVEAQPDPTVEDLMGWPGKMNAATRENVEDILSKIVRIRKYMEAPVEQGGFDPHVPDAVANRESLVRAEREWMEQLNTFLGRDGGRMYTLEDYLRLSPEQLKGDPFLQAIRKYFPYWNGEAGLFDYKPPRNLDVAKQTLETLREVMDPEMWNRVDEDIEIRAHSAGFEDMTPILQSVAQREGMRTVAEWITTNTTPTSIEMARVVVESNIARSVRDFIRMEHDYRMEHPEYPRPESSRIHTARLKGDINRKLRRKLEKQLLVGKDPETVQRDVMRYIEENIDGEIMRRLEESSHGYRALSPEHKEAVFMLFLNRLSKDFYPRGKVHPGTTYEDIAARGLEKKHKFAERPHAGMTFRTHPTQLELQNAVKQLQRHFEPHVGGMMAEWNTIWESAKLGVERRQPTSRWQGFAQLLRDHPIASTLAAGAGVATIANAIASPTVGGSLLAAGLFAVPISGKMAPGFFGTPRTEARLRTKQAGFLRALRDTVEEPEAITTLQDLIKRGDLHGAKMTIAKWLGTPEVVLGSPAVMPWMNAQTNIHRWNSRDYAHFFEGSNRHKAVFYGMKEGTALSSLLGRWLDWFRADNGGFAMEAKERKKKLKEELYGLDDKGQRIFSDEDIKAFWYAESRVFKWLEKRRKELGEEFGIHINREEFGIDGYFPHVFEHLQGDKGWKEKIGSWFTSKDLAEMPSVLNRRGSLRGNYTPDAVKVMRTMAPAFRRIIELRRAVNKMEPFIYGQYENIGGYIDAVMKERHPEPTGEGRVGDLQAKLAAVHTARDTESLRLLQEVLAPIGHEQFHSGGVKSRTLGRKQVDLGIRIPGSNDTWFPESTFKSGDNHIILRRSGIQFGERHGYTLEQIKAGKADGYKYFTISEFMDQAKVRVNGMLQAGLTGRIELAEQFAKWAVGEKYSKFSHTLEKYLGGVAYFATIGSFNPRPAMHNLIGGQWLNMTELGMRYAMDGIKLASEVKAQPNSYYGQLLKRSGIMAEGTYLWSDMRQHKVGKAWGAFQKFGYFWFQKTENFNKASAFLGGAQRALDRMEMKHGKAKDKAEITRREEQAIQEGKRAVNRTVSMYGAYNAPGLFRHPMGRLLMHLNRFSVLMFNRVVDMAARAKTKKDYGRIFRLMAYGGMIYQLGTMLGQDLHFVFGQQAEDLGEPFMGEGVGQLAPSLRAPSPELWRLATNPSDTLRKWKEAPGGFMGDMIIPFALPYDWSPPVRIALDTARFAAGAINDDAGVLEGFADRWSSEGQRTMELAIPFYGVLKRAYQAGAAAGVGPMQELASQPGGFFKFRDMGPDWADENRYEIRGLRDRLSYRTNRENIFRRLLAPGIPIQTLRNIRDNQVDRSLGKIWMENRKMGWDRFLDSLVNGRMDEAREILEVHDMDRVRMQDIQRMINMREMPGWIRGLSGPAEKKFQLISRRWKEGNTPPLEIFEALNAHLSASSVKSLRAEELDLLGRMVRDVVGRIQVSPSEATSQ